MLTRCFDSFNKWQEILFCEQQTNNWCNKQERTFLVLMAVKYNRKCGQTSWKAVSWNGWHYQLLQFEEFHSVLQAAKDVTITVKENNTPFPLFSENKLPVMHLEELEVGEHVSSLINLIDVFLCRRTARLMRRSSMIVLVLGQQVCSGFHEETLLHSHGSIKFLESGNLPLRVAQLDETGNFLHLTDSLPSYASFSCLLRQH